jgi:hypothetical protein
VTEYSGQLGLAPRDSASAADLVCSGMLAESQSAWKPVASPPIASTSSSSTPQDGRRGAENTLETVVREQPASRASTRRLGQPAS